VIVDPILSIYLSVQLYAEHFTDDAVKLTLAAVGFIGMCAGVVLLTRTAPSNMAANVDS
jgi:hypothetical protein